ncbi:MAG: radical SAM protein, partial [Phycisphaerae bacterium]|nr:radical SAM protein [Phycisphaerae bacterium]
VCPDRAGRVLSLVRSSRGGELNDTAWQRRFRGSGPYADQIRQSFKVFAARHGFGRGLPALNSDDFHPPAVDRQLPLFGGAARD